MTFLPNITAKTARENYNIYHKNLDNNKFAMLKYWLERIEQASLEGYESALTTKFYTNARSEMHSYSNAAGELIQLNYIPLSEIADFFEERGFHVQLRNLAEHAYYYIISW